MGDLLGVERGAGNSVSEFFIQITLFHAGLYYPKYFLLFGADPKSSRTDRPYLYKKLAGK